MKVRDAQKLRDVLFIAGIAVMLAAYIFGTVCSIIGAVVAFSGLIPHFLYNKCPHCGRQLGRNDGDYCQHCGGAID
ncbi:MAG: hypothetical protein IJ364_08020 [Oscillospiraceae bacterium]|nr:hypothetical protein [Oscillospiraceae bacterium]